MSMDPKTWWAVAEPAGERDTLAIKPGVAIVMGRCAIVREPLHDGEGREPVRCATGILVSVLGVTYGLFWQRENAANYFELVPTKEKAT